MLAAKPYFDSKRFAAEAEKSAAARKAAAGAEGAALTDSHHDDHADAGGHGHSFSDLFVHQAIESIEFVISSVSNTASYLRLWALSLAHSQLATVFWERALVDSIYGNSTMSVFIGYAAFFGVTAAVLLVMDVLECFLHALRLHCVEFMSKVRLSDCQRAPTREEAQVEA